MMAKNLLEDVFEVISQDLALLCNLPHFEEPGGDGMLFVRVGGVSAHFEDFFDKQKSPSKFGLKRVDALFE